MIEKRYVVVVVVRMHDQFRHNQSLHGTTLNGNGDAG